MTESGYDAAYAPGRPPVGDQVVMLYLGGDTPHVATLAEWNSQAARFRIGIWTRSNPQGAAQGTAEGRAAAAAWKALGATPGSLTVLDFETAVDAPYVAAYDAEIVAAGFRCALYGSTSTVFRNPKPSGGYCPADLTGQPHLYPGTLLTQWKFEQAWDDDTVSAAAVLWDTHPAPQPVPTPPSSRRENDMHVDLRLNAPVVFTNPAAVLGGTGHLLLASDFGDATVRVAVFSFKSASWTVTNHPIGRAAGAFSLELPADANKVSVEMTEGNCPVGLDVLAG